MSDTKSFAFRSSLGLLPVLLLLGGCPDDKTLPPVAEGIFGPLGTARPNATDTERATFERGEAVALRRFTPEMGLGPAFNVTFCGACHEKPVFGGSAGRYRDFLLVEQQLSDGSAVPLGVGGVQPQFHNETGRLATEEAVNHFAERSPIPFFGVGLLAEVSEESILANVDPDDRNGDGISGRPNLDRGFIGRFGRKAQTVSIEGFIRGPLGNHAGITSNPLTEESRAALPVASPVFERMEGEGGVGRRTDGQASAPDEPLTDDDGVSDPELSDRDLFDLVSWAMLLAAPQPEPLTEITEQGSMLFDQANCSGCHVRGLVSPRGLIPAYSDLLLHDMGDELADGFRFGEADGNEFRTQPLWGIAAVGPFLHDGRADTLDEAIRWHGGEAQAAKEAYEAMTEGERTALVEFLLSLGGRDQTTSGLIPPGAPIPEGVPGAPLRSLTGDDATRFLDGRALFDRDMFFTEGLGPLFNGDSCRACHFDPVVGGAGPGDVDVIRHGRWDGDDFVAPSGGTIAHRHASDASRPAVLEDANIVERRQTPSILGLGLLEAASIADVMSRHDPDDMDGDGIAGVAHVLPDGRLGRLGWKADVPSLHEFVRDALGAEMGMTVPDEDGQSYGAATDGDELADPEMTVEQIAQMTFFLQMLAPPVPVSENAALEADGAMAFADAGCDGCHVTLRTEAGTPVAAFTDLLLHDVQAADYVGVPSMNAGERMFRTAPLWGVRDTAPYWHDARAATLEEAVAAHAGEAAASRVAYEALDAAAREALLAYLRSL